MAPPTASLTLPQYIANGLPKQDDETLRGTREYIDQLLADRERRREEPVTEDKNWAALADHSAEEPRLFGVLWLGGGPLIRGVEE